jgi:uncharacterized protein DUF1566/fibronectin type III domain protein
MKIIVFIFMFTLVVLSYSLSGADDYGTMASNNYQIFLADMEVVGGGANGTSIELVFSLMTPYQEVYANDNAGNSLTTPQYFIISVPGAPTIGTATGGDAQATVSFTPPGSNGGSAITGYTATSSPAGGVDSNADTTGLSHVITGLTNGTAYTFKVTATNVAGTGSPSAASNSATPVAPVNGACGTSNGGAFMSVPSANLCSMGSEVAVSGTGPWSWSCDGLNGGSSANCSANLQYTVTPFAGVGGNITPNNPQTVITNNTVSFSITPSGTNTIASVSGCSGTLIGSTYTTGQDGGNCDVVVMFSNDGKKLPVVQVPQTGQAGCWDVNGTAISCSGSGQDAAKSFGAALPSSRFINNNNGTITDNLTGLVWLKKGDCFGTLSWTNAVNGAGITFLADGTCGLTDGSTPGAWRLPNRKELMSLVNWQQEDMAAWLNSQGFINIQKEFYWSSSSRLNDSSNAYVVSMDSGGVTTYRKTNLYNVLGVRNGN